MSSSSLGTLWIIIPVFNEAKHLTSLVASIKQVQKTFDKHYLLHILFVDDGSRDASPEILAQLTREYPYIKRIEFSRNFGKEAAITAGLMEAKGDAVILMDADLQHPPEYLIEFIRAWENGAEVVIGQRENNQASLFRRMGSWLYYRILNLLSTQDVMSGNTDFRLLDRRVVDAFIKLPEHDRMTRELIDWLGFRRVLIPFRATERAHGNSHYPYRRLIHLALSSFMANSLFPLKVAGYLGILMMTASLLIGAYASFDRFVLGNFNFSGPFLSGVLNMFLTSLTLSCLGLIALYVGSIKNDTRDRPLFVIRRGIEE